MKKNLSRLYIIAFFLFINANSLLSSQGDLTNSLIDSSIVIIPTKRGLGLSSYFGDKWYGETENTLYMLENNQFDHNNQSCYNKLARAIADVCIDNPDLTKAIKIISLIDYANQKTCLQNSKKINLLNQNFFNLHYFLDNKKQEKLDALKTTLKIDNDEYILQFNTKLDAIKQSFCDQIEQLKKINTQYTIKKNEHIVQSTNEIKEIKTALMQLHQINPKQTVFKIHNRQLEDPYCSDSEKDSKNLDVTYSHENVLKKIDAKNSLETIEQFTQKTTQLMSNIFNTLTKIQGVKQ